MSITAKARTYRSAVRERQAEETRQGIADAAQRLLQERGYVKMTVEAVAREAGVAPQTVYAVFGSKVGIVGELVNRLVFFEGHETLYAKAVQESDPRESLRLFAHLVRRVFEAVAPLREVLRGTTVLDPELARLARRHDKERRDRMGDYVGVLHVGQSLRPDLDPEHALDVLWTLTSCEPYRLLVEECGWPAERYEAWLFDMLEHGLLRCPSAPQVFRSPGRPL